jgi:hypothetical protein
MSTWYTGKTIISLRGVKIQGLTDSLDKPINCSIGSLTTKDSEPVIAKTISIRII